jgi:hypothetical protein
VIEDLDQGKHLSRIFTRHPLGLDLLRLGGGGPCDVSILDTAPEGRREQAVEHLRRADWLLIPVMGPEEGSVQALPALLQWLREADGARLLGFLPTMHKPRPLSLGTARERPTDAAGNWRRSRCRCCAVLDVARRHVDGALMVWHHHRDEVGVRIV